MIEFPGDPIGAMTDPEDMLMSARIVLEDYYGVFPVVGNGPIAPTGESYIEITSMMNPPRPHEEGKLSDIVHLTPRGAVLHWLHSVRTYAPQPATIYWRIVPEIECVRLITASIAKLYVEGDDQYKQWSEMSIWKVYSRLLVSSKPLLQKQVAA